MKSLFCLLIVLFSLNTSYGQDWKQYPYSPDKSLISFPKDEGYHPEQSTEWWYTFAKLKGKETGKEYTVMFTFFYRDTLIFDGLRIFNISDEETKEFFHDAKPVNYSTNSTEYLDIEAQIYGQNRTETWKTKVDSNGDLIPFNYSLKASADFGSIDLDYDVIKRPLILADSGYLHQGISNYTYYYSFTEIDVSGNLTLKGISEEVEGKAWFDKQYGNFHPEVEEKYEWLSLKLSNGTDINLWEVFNSDLTVPQTSEYKQFNCYIDDSTDYNTIDFKIERLEYFYSPDSARVYCKKFLITEPGLDLELTVEVTNPNCEPSFPFEFYEGPLLIEGSIGGIDVQGYGFGELLHNYEKPETEFIYPIESWDRDSTLRWTVTNPDYGRPVNFDLFYKSQGDDYKLLAKSLKEPYYKPTTISFDQDSLYSFLLVSYTNDRFLVDSTNTGFLYPVGVNSFVDADFCVYPTLFDQNINVEIPRSVLNKSIHILILNEDNKIVFDKNNTKGNSKIQLYTGNIPEGIYFIYIAGKDFVFTKKIIHAGK